MIEELEVEGVEARVCEDIAGRQQVGINKYGMTVEQNPLTLREWAQHAYEETLDQAVYLRKFIEELDEIIKRPSGSEGFKGVVIDDFIDKVVEPLAVKDHPEDPSVDPFQS